MKTIVVTAGIIEKEQSILLAQRLPDDINYPLMWEFPGGKLELGEEPEECLVREIKEELAINIEVGEIFQVITFQLSQKNIILLAYKCKWLSGEPRPIQCAGYAWIRPEDLVKYEIVPNDIKIAKKILAQL